jgi:hypothetical protein
VVPSPVGPPVREIFGTFQSAALGSLLVGKVAFRQPVSSSDLCHLWKSNVFQISPT